MKTFKCLKCGGGDYETGQLRGTGGFWTKIFNIQNRKFVTLTCRHCKFTEFYDQKGDNLTPENVLDFFVN